MFEKIIELDKTITLAINGSHSVILDSFALVVTSTIAWIPIGLFLLWYIYRNNGTKTMLMVLGSILLCVLVADSVSSGIFKPLIERWRPTRDPEMLNLVDVVNGYRGGRYGFFSSHAANTCSVAVFLCMLFNTKKLTLMFIAFTLVNCWSRIYLGVHFFGDVIVGLIFGTFVGWGIFRLYAKLGGQRASDELDYVFVANLASYIAFLLVAGFLANAF